MRHVLALLLLVGCTPEPPPDLDDDNANGDDNDPADSNADGCEPDGDACEVNANCCGFEDGVTLCVNVDVQAYCLPYCNGPGDCSSFCCAPLEAGGGACVPEEYCGGGTSYVPPDTGGGTFW